MKPMAEYIRMPGRNTELFTTRHPLRLLKKLQAFVATKPEEEEVKMVQDETTYKATITSPQQNVELVAKVLKVKDGQFCLDFTRKKGELLDFMNLFKEIKDFVGPLTTTSIP